MADGRMMPLLLTILDTALSLKTYFGSYTTSLLDGNSFQST